MTPSVPTPAKAAEPADLREALCSHHWHEAFGVTTGRSWRRAVAEAEERGPDSAAAEQVARFRNCADRQIAGPLAQREAAHAAEIQAREAEIAGLKAERDAHGEYIIDLEHKVFHAEAHADRLAADVDAVLTEACRMGSILLMAGEMTAQERRTASAVAKGIAWKVRAALKTKGGEDGRE